MLDDVVALGGQGGLIALDPDGKATLPFAAEAMPRGFWRSGDEPAVWL